MLDRRGLRNAAIVGVAALFIASVATGLYGWIDPEPPEIADSVPLYVPEATYQPGGENCRPENLARIRSASKRQRETDECADKTNDHRREQNDLRQQWRSANAAERVARLSEAQIRASIVEAGIVFFALVAAGWAAWETRQSVKVQRMQLEESERPQFFVSIKELFDDYWTGRGALSDISPEPPYREPIDERTIKHFANRIELHNVGTRAAIGVSFSVAIGFEGASDEKKRTTTEGVAEIAAGGKPNEFVQFSSPNPIFDRLEAGEVMHITGRFVYDDALGVRRERGFRFVAEWSMNPFRRVDGPPWVWTRSSDPRFNYDRRIEA